jgi:hypothetical protein
MPQIFDLITRRVWHHTDKISSELYRVHIPLGSRLTSIAKEPRPDRINFAYPGSEYDSIYVYYGSVFRIEINGEDLDIFVNV